MKVEIEVVAQDEANLPDLLDHITKEITDYDYRMNEIMKTREVKDGWLCLEHGKYKWIKKDHS